MDWGTILSNNIDSQIQEYKQNWYVITKVVPPFFMNAYIMGVVCFNSNFTITGWKWTIHNPTHILNESNFHGHFYKIFHKVIMPIHQVVFYKIFPRLFKEVKIDFIPIGKFFCE